MKNLIAKSLAAVVIISLLAFTKDNPAYLLYNNKGKQVKYKRMVKELADADIVLFGELHDNPIGHWLQIEVAEDIYRQVGDRLVLGAEMFERDNQLILDEYLSGVISERNFKNEMKLWNNYETDYKPLVEFARVHDLPFLATNIPRRYASLVFGSGFGALENLPSQAQQYIVPMPIEVDMELSSYQEMKDMAGGHGGEYLIHAQAIKDATMAHTILQNWEDGQLFLHYNGAFHSKYHEGIVWYLHQTNPDLKVVTIQSVLQKDIDQLEEGHEGLGDYILVIPENMTKTY